MALSRAPICFAAVFVIAICALSPSSAAAAEEVSSVLTLDASNFSDTVAKHPFIVVEFYAPWCGHCKKLTPEYEKAASVLSKHDPPVVLAKVDANEGQNKEIASKYEVKGYPTLKILRNGGENIQDYKGPREADGIIEYLKKQVGPASAEIKSTEDASNLLSEQKVFIVGIFPEFSGEEFESFIAVAEKLRSEYDFRHTLDAKLLPRGESNINLPIVRLLKPFDELFVDSKDFDLVALEDFIQSSSVPVITTFNKDPNNHPYVIKFFNSPNTKAMLFLDFSNEHIDAFQTKYHEAAEHNRGNNISFLIGNLDDSKAAFQYYGLKEDQVPLIIIQGNDGQKYLKQHLQPNEISVWLKEYMDGSLKPFKKSEPIPEINDEPVKVVVADNIHDVVSTSGKNVLIEFYAPWCGHCKKLAPILDEVAVSFQDDADVVIAKMDATANDLPNEFEVKGYPTLYFSSASGKLTQYDGGRAAKDIIDFIQANKDVSVKPDSGEDKPEPEPEPTKDEL